MSPFGYGALAFAGLLLSVGVPATQQKPGAEAKLKPGPVRLVRTLEQPGARIAALNFSADGSRLLASAGKTLVLWDPATGKELTRFGHQREWTGLAALSPDGRTVAACFGVGWEIVLFDAASGQVQHRLPHNHMVSGFMFAPDSKTLISTGGADRTARLWDVATGKELRWMRLRHYATGEEIDPKQPRPQFEYSSTYGVAFSPDGKTVAVGVEDGSIRLCDPATGVELRRLFHEDDEKCEVYYLMYSPDGRFLVAGGVTFRVGARLWDMATGKAIQEFHLPPRPGRVPDEVPPEKREWFERQLPALVQALAFSPDGKTLAISRESTWLWEVATGRVRHRFPVSTITLAFSPTGLLATGGEKYAYIDLWDWRDPCLKLPQSLSAKELDQLWSDLAAANATVGYRAIATLRADPPKAVAMFTKRLQPIEAVTAAQLEQLIAELGDEKFPVRERAYQRLVTLNEAARLALQKALSGKPSQEVKVRVEKALALLDGPIAPRQLRYLRAMEVLESIGTAEARRVLQQLAGGAAGAVETEDARAALMRLAQKKAV
jgi:WD40 repeat protein